MMRRLLKFLLLPSMALLPLACQTTFDFSTPVQTSPTQAPGKWYTDRYAPHQFVSPVTAPDGTPNALQESISPADSTPNRPAPYSSAFYSTQGRHFDLASHPLSVTIKLYVPNEWASQNERKAGFWATAFTGGDATGDYPIIEFEGPTTTNENGPGYYPNGGVAGFYGWNNVSATYDLIGLPAGFQYNSWVQLTMTLVPGSKIVYTVSSTQNSVSLDSPLGSSNDAYLGDVILEGYNYGLDYDIFWAGGDVSSLTNEYLTSSWWFWYVV